jgi:acetyltransferase-like isoleucine patch superfamily enzyme
MTDFFAHKTAEISPDAQIGKGTKIWHYAQIREDSIIGKGCNIGKSVYIDKNVKIGNNVKIQNGVSVYDGIVVEDDVILGPHCSFTNDLYPRAFNEEWKIVPTLIKKGAAIGSNATILCGITVGEYSMVGAGAVVIDNTLPYSLMVGNPARLKNFVCHCGNELFLKEINGNKYSYLCKECEKNLTILFQIETIKRSFP